MGCRARIGNVVLEVVFIRMVIFNGMELPVLWSGKGWLWECHLGHESHLVVVCVGRLNYSLIGSLSVSSGLLISIRWGSGGFCVSMVEAVIIGCVHGTIVGLVVGILLRLGASISVMDGLAAVVAFG